MSLHFHRLTVKEVKKETPECVSVLFDVPETLQNDFQFSQGQSLTLRTTINGEEIRRNYSICSSPLENKLKVAIKKVEGGLFSSFANEQLKKGDVLDVMPPVGKFNTPLHPENKKNYLAFAAGSGITPVISLIKTTLATEKYSRFTLVFGNRNRNSIIFFEELEALKNQYMERFSLVHILSRERMDTDLNFGRISPEKLEELDRLEGFTGTDEFFICGPAEMIFTVKAFLEKKGIAGSKIHLELFNSTKSPQTTVHSPQINTPGAVSTINVKVDGRSFEVTIPFNSDQSILDAALQQGADLPYACKGGMCCTCKAKLLEGEVSMDVHWGLEEEEVAKGYILTCQSHPKTEKVVVDFDAK
ncbi:MAG TPA: phenylacetate-CoA oxygenase/reductase subunit PaaK [Chitinophagaceae bacterium]|nr:phenylacetate-CoA oxygenase/reductase subunit PaaK [Chitinophagaceae bacterium]